MYLLSIDKLQPGDIILTLQKGLASKSVRIATKSKYSHAILHVGDGSYIHSDKNGVHSGNIQRLLFDKIDSARVLRTKNAYAAKLACDFARSQIGKSYSIKEAIKTKFYIPKFEQNNRQFCSRLVAQSYEYAGLTLVNNPKYCIPQELDDSPLTFLINKCLKKLL